MARKGVVRAAGVADSRRMASCASSETNMGEPAENSTHAHGDRCCIGTDHAQKGDLHKIVAKLERSLSEGGLNAADGARTEAKLRPLLKKLRADPYFALKCGKRATIGEVRKNYLNLARQYHPDKSGGNTLRLFQAIQQAFEELRGNGDKNETSKRKSRATAASSSKHGKGASGSNFRTVPIPALLSVCVERDGQNANVFWKPSPLASKYIVRYQIETSMDGRRLTPCIKSSCSMRISPLLQGAVYAFRVRVGIVERETGKQAWGAFSKPVAFAEAFKAPQLTEARFESPTSVILRWDAEGCFQVQWRILSKSKLENDNSGAWKATNPPEIRGSQCRKKRIPSGSSLQFRIRACNPSTKLVGPWSKVRDLSCKERPLAEENDIESTKIESSDKTSVQILEKSAPRSSLRRTTSKNAEPNPGGDGAKDSSCAESNVNNPPIIEIHDQKCGSESGTGCQNNRLDDHCSTSCPPGLSGVNGGASTVSSKRKGISFLERVREHRKSSAAKLAKEDAMVPGDGDCNDEDSRWEHGSSPASLNAKEELGLAGCARDKTFKCNGAQGKECEGKEKGSEIQQRPSRSSSWLEAERARLLGCTKLFPGIAAPAIQKAQAQQKLGNLTSNDQNVPPHYVDLRLEAEKVSSKQAHANKFIFFDSNTSASVDDNDTSAKRASQGDFVNDADPAFDGNDGHFFGGNRIASKKSASNRDTSSSLSLSEARKRHYAQVRHGTFDRAYAFLHDLSTTVTPVDREKSNFVDVHRHVEAKKDSSTPRESTEVHRSWFWGA